MHHPKHVRLILAFNVAHPTVVALIRIDYLSPFQGLRLFILTNPGLTPWAAFCRHFVASGWILSPLRGLGSVRHFVVADTFVGFGKTARSNLGTKKPIL